MVFIASEDKRPYCFDCNYVFLSRLSYTRQEASNSKANQDEVSVNVTIIIISLPTYLSLCFLGTVLRLCVGLFSK